MDNMDLPPLEPQMNSLNVEIVELDGVEDVTVRPMREPFRSSAVKKYGLSIAPPARPNDSQRQPNPS
jgi:hypothetical protein